MTFSPFVVAFGEEDFFLDRDIERARQGKRDILQLNGGDGLTDIVIVDLCETQCDAPRTVIVDNAQKVKGSKELSRFIENRNLSDRSLILVAIIRDKKLPEVWELAATKGKRFERDGFKRWEIEKYIDFIKTEASRLSVVIDKNVAGSLFKYVGYDLYRLENELRKLATYVGQAGTITKEHLSYVVSPTPKVEAFEVATEVMKKNWRSALSSFSVLYMNNGDNALIPVIRSLMKQVEKTAIIRHLQDRGIGAADIASLIGVKEWVYKNISSPIAQKHDSESLVRYMRQLCRLDADVKSSAQSKRTMVELTLLSIARSP
jgi:DNA polymerase III delta subunit